MADDVNIKGQLTGGDRISVAGLFTANANRALAEGVTLKIAAGVSVTADDSFESLAARLGPPVTPTALAMANAGDETLLRVDAVIEYQESAKVVRPRDTLITMARRFRARFTDFLGGAVDLFSDQRLFAGNQTALVPVITCQAGDASTFDSLAKTPAYASSTGPGMTGAQLATQNAARPILRTGEKITIGNRPPYIVAPGDCLADVALALHLTVAELVGDGTVLAQPRLLADGAVLVLPPFDLKIPAGQTLASIAERTAATVEALASWPGNGAVEGLFAVGAAGTPRILARRSLT